MIEKLEKKHSMKKVRFKKEQIIGILKEAEAACCRFDVGYPGTEGGSLKKLLKLKARGSPWSL